MKNLFTKILVAIIMLIVSNQVIAGTFNQTICSGTSTTIGNVYPGATLYQWNTIPPQYTPTITVSPIVNTSYIVNVFSGVTWMLADTFNITVNALPVGTITPSQTICAGVTVTLTASGGGTYLWSNGATTSSITVTPSSTTTYSVVITGTNSCTITLSSTVTVNPLPVITTVGSNTPVCVTDTLYLNASATPNGCSYAWIGPNGFTSNQQNPTIPNVTIANAGTYTCTAILNSCSSTPLSTTVVVNPLPNGTVTPSQSICAGQTITLTATGGTSYLWSTGATTSSISVTPSTTTTYSVVITGTGGCSISLSSTVTVSPIPNGTVTPSQSICAGQTVTLTATGGGTYLWSTGATTSSISVTPSTTTTYSVVITGTGNCSITLGTTVTVNAVPTVSASGSGNICEGETIYLLANGTAGCTYAWTGPNNFSSNLQNPTIPNATIAATGTYNVTATLNGCSATANTNVTVTVSPNASISGNTNICIGSSTTLTASGGGTYLWSNGSTNASITVNPFTTTTYSVVVTGPNGCTCSASATVVVNQVPNMNISPNNPRICEGENITLSVGGANTYVWNTGETSSSITVSPNIPTTYTVTGTNAPGCSSTINVVVQVDPKPNVTLNLPQQNICLDANPITLNGGYPYGGSYYGSGIFGGLFYPSTVGVGTYNIYYEYTNAYGCKATASQLLAVNPKPKVEFKAIFPNPVDLNASAFQLNTAIPLGGVYSGPGVANGWFYPTTAGVGIHTIVYSYIDFMSCTNTAMATITVVNGLGIEDQSSSLIRIFPNPVTDYLNIEMEEKADYVQIFNLTGSVLSTSKVDSEKFRVSVIHLTKGIYFIKFIYEDGSVGVVKFVK